MPKRNLSRNQTRTILKIHSEFIDDINDPKTWGVRVGTAVSEPLGLGYEAARRRALKSMEEIAPSTYEPTLTTWVDPEDDRVYTDIPIYPPVALVQTTLSLEWSGVVKDEIFSQRYRFRSLEREQERVVVTFRALWRPMLALEAWTGQTDAQRAAL
ncbi:hypothetical protein Tco_1038619 [Tanacetum coccineum]